MFCNNNFHIEGDVKGVLDVFYTDGVARCGIDVCVTHKHFIKNDVSTLKISKVRVFASDKDVEIALKLNRRDKVAIDGYFNTELKENQKVVLRLCATSIRKIEEE